jgi:type IV pilus assembly protein PilB
MSEKREVILEELLRREMVSLVEVERAEARSETENKSALDILMYDRVISEIDVFKTVALAAKLPFVNPDDVVVDPSASDKLNPDWAKKLRALPFAWQDSKLMVAIDDPGNIDLVDDLRRLTGVEPQLVLAPTAQLLRKIGAIYRTDSDLVNSEFGDAAIVGLDVANATVDLDNSGGGLDDDERQNNAVVKFVGGLISQAVADRASDIHLEPTEDKLEIRYRIDGVLQAQRSQSKTWHSGVLARIKVLANMDIAEKRIPQDGRITVRATGGQVIDLRVATLPTVYGEKAVLRILDNKATAIDLTAVGLSPYHQSIYNKYAKSPTGMILVTGPTGSGKSTTLYATLNDIKSSTINIITVEDPVEFRMDGVSQIQINNKAGMTFPSALRSILRSDPDVILIGEIRDKETAKIAIESALTGHMVLTTLHTNDAASAITRLVEMGTEPFLVGSAVKLVVAQRLVRRLCDKCAEPYTATQDQLESIGFRWPEDKELPVFKKPIGCGVCAGTGYKGRLPIHEMLEVTPLVERLINEGAQADQIQAAAQQVDGMRLMKEDGFSRVVNQETTVEEILRVVG